MRILRGRSCAFLVGLMAYALCGSASAQGDRGFAFSRDFSREAALVIPNGEWLLGYEQMQEAVEARRSNPDAVAARMSSSRRFEGLDAGNAAILARSSFPQLVTQRNGGPPHLDSGERIVRSVGDYAAAVKTRDGRHMVVESSEPMFAKTATGLVPVDLSLQHDRGVFRPKRPAAGVSVRIPERLSVGPSLSALGVSLTPVDRQGVVLSSSPGVIDGSTVFYAHSEKADSGVLDLDTLVKPETLGFAEESILRSERSPHVLYFKVKLPVGARLQRSDTAEVRVLDADQAIASIAAPAAVDAEGTPVPLSLGVSGHTLTIKVEHKPGEYKMPIAVDPHIDEEQLNVKGLKPTNWHFEHSFGGTAFTASENPEGKGWTEHIAGGHSESEWGAMVYTTQGTSSITDLWISGIWHDTGASIQNSLVLVAPNGVAEGKESMPSESTSGATWSVCAPEPECWKKTPASGNSAEWLQASNAPGIGIGGENTLEKTIVFIEQPTGPELTFNKTSPILPNGMPNALYGSNTWLGTGTAIEAKAHDPGIGISYFGIAGGSWVERIPLLEEGECTGGAQCPEDFNPIITGSPSMSEGEVSFEAIAYDAMNTYAQVWPLKIKVDVAAPHNLVLSGLPSNDEVSFKPYTLKAEASDGSTKASSGVKSIGLKIDGHEIGAASGSCSPGPCTAKSGSWTINGQEYAAGPHLLAVTATDNAGNVETENITVTVRTASPVAVGPGDVNPESGEVSLQTTDVAEGEGLSVTRSYRSQHLLAGSGGPLGAQWAISTGSVESLEPQTEGGVVLTDQSGSQVIFASNGSGGYNAPTGDANLTLSRHEVGGVTEYILANAAKGTSTRFTLPAGGGTLWKPTVQEGPVATDTTTYRYETIEVAGKKVTRPVEELAPVPSGVSCSPEVKRGCRALTFNYASSTTATGENQSQWGDYSGNLTRVYLKAYYPIIGMVTQTVGQYLYDSHGRLRTEWNPQISPALKTFYGYDSENHLTALTSPGLETWAFTYGALANNTIPGRLVKVAQAPASAPLWAGESPKIAEAPQLSGSPVVGVRMTVSDGSWSGSPVAYAYTWQDCNTSGAECKTIPGANNPNYTPTSGDLGHTIVAQVSATNGGGSVVAATAASATVSVVLSGGLHTQLVDSGNSLNAVSCVPGTTDCVVSDGKGAAFYATNVSATSNASWNTWTGPGASPSEALSCPTTSLCLMAAGSDGGYGGNLYYATSLGGAWTLGYSPLNGVDAISCVSASFCVDGQNNYGYFRYSTSPASTVWTLESQASAPMKGVSCVSSSFCAIVDGAGSVHVANTTTQIESSSWTETKVNGTTALNGIACVSTTSCVAVDGSGNVINLAIATNGVATATKHNLDGTNSLTAITCTTNSTCVTVDNQGNIFISVNNGETWSEQYQLGNKLNAVSCSSASLCVTVDTTGNIATFNPIGRTVFEGESRTPQPGSTIEYGVTVSGSGAPQKLSASDVASWGQSDDPIEGAAVFPPDKPEGWPAPEVDYKHATIYYFDEKGRNVNVASPTSGISTSEYNENNDVTRELSPDNRASALGEGAKAVEASRLLDSQFTYNGDGTELLSQLGPRHTVKLTSGEEVAARHHTIYKYDEGAPEGGPYRLVTKLTEGAQIEGGSEQDIRTTTTSYGGQEGLGWKLREPTSVTTDPSGLKLTQTLVYDPSTGDLVENRKPASGGEGNAHDTKTVYYTSAANSGYPTCGSHAEWANLPCETLPGAQPETSGIPNLPVTTTTYNYLLEPSVVTETVGTDTRTTKYTYDESGRLTKSAITSSVGTSLPAVTDEYDSKTGLLVKQKTTVESVTTSLTKTYNSLGELTGYTDADTNASSYEYDVDGRTTFVNDGKGTRAYAYDPTTGLLTKLTDSAAGAFTATYDIEGNMLTEAAPDGITAHYSYSPIGDTTHLEYAKTSSCGNTCTWFDQKVVTSIHGQTISQSNTLAQTAYKYDETGRLTEVAETPSGQGCNTRIYSYDTETNTTSLTSRQPGAEGKCATEGGTVSSHVYDPGNRLTDSGVKYDSLGNTTILPAADAGGSGLTSTFYSDSRLASLTQAGEAVSYHLDPSYRVREIISTGNTASTIVNHYKGAGDAPSWTVDLAGKWTRNISGINGELAATQTNGETPVMQLTDLQGNVIATASHSEAATALLSTTRSTEYGVPTTNSPPKYSWLGGPQRPTELPSGVVAMGARGYVPQLGRFLQVDPVADGSTNPYAYTNGDPVNMTDLSGAYVENDYLQEFNEEEKEIAVENRIAAEEAAREEAERKAEEAAEAAEAAIAEVEQTSNGGAGSHRNRHKGHSHSGGAIATASYGCPGPPPCLHKANKGGPYKGAHPGLGGKSKEPNHPSRKKREKEEAEEAKKAKEESADAAAAAEKAWQEYCEWKEYQCYGP